MPLAEVSWPPLSKWRMGVGCAAVHAAMLLPLTAPTAAMPRKSWSRAGAGAPIQLTCVVWLHRRRSCQEQRVPRRQVAVLVPQSKSARGERPRPAPPRRRGWLQPPWRPTGADQVLRPSGHSPHAEVSCGKCCLLALRRASFMSTQRSDLKMLPLAVTARATRWGLHKRLNYQSGCRFGGPLAAAAWPTELMGTGLIVQQTLGHIISHDNDLLSAAWAASAQVIQPMMSRWRPPPGYARQCWSHRRR